jgi:hypothetical protein
VIEEIGRGKEGMEFAAVVLAESDQESNRSSDDRCSQSQRRTRVALESTQKCFHRLRRCFEIVLAVREKRKGMEL